MSDEASEGIPPLPDAPDVFPARVEFTSRSESGWSPQVVEQGLFTEITLDCELGMITLRGTTERDVRIYSFEQIARVTLERR